MKPNYLENIPQNWQITKLKYVTIRIGDGIHATPNYTDNSDILFINGNNLVDGKIKANKKTNTVSLDEFDKYNLNIKKGSVLISINGTLGNLAIYNLERIVLGKSAAYIECSEHIHNYFLYFYFKTNIFEHYMEKSLSGTTIKNLSLFTIRNMPIILPPLSEQQKIANFLDKKTTELDIVIKNKKNLIKLLQEDEKAFINEKLTDTEGKWISRKVNWSFNLIGSGTTPNTNIEDYYKNGTISWVNTGDLNNDILYKSKKKITELALETHSVLKLYPKNTLLIALYGATIGKVSLLDFEACTNQACCALGESVFFDMKIVFYWFLVNRQKIIDLGYGGGQPNISQDIIKNLRLPCPPIEEQKKIVAEIENHIHKNRQVLEKLSKEVDLLKEYRQSLISEAVTGQLVI